MADKFNAEEAMSMMMDGMPQVSREKVQSDLGQPKDTADPKKKAKKEAKISAQIDAGTLAQVRAISEKEGVSIRSIFEVALGLYIKAYTAKHGPIRGKKARRGDANDLI